MTASQIRMWRPVTFAGVGRAAGFRPGAWVLTGGLRLADVTGSM
jgi:hypothetical protein